MSTTNDQPPLPRYMTRKEVAGLYRVSERTVMRWMAMGRLQALRIGGTIRFSRRHVIEAAEKYEYGDQRKPQDPALG